MATFSANGVNLYYEETGEGFPLVWSHEFAGNYPSWDPQVKFFSRRYRVITYSARGVSPVGRPRRPRCLFPRPRGRGPLPAVAAPANR